jgi:putative inorganic carbon (HCO3(-)) transporter
MDNYGKYKNKPEYRGIVTANALYAHNNFLHMAAEIGLLGLGIFFWFLYGLFKQATGNYQNQKEGFMKVATLSAIVCLIAFLVNGFTESSLYSSRVAILFWYLAGFSLVNREK